MKNFSEKITKLEPRYTNCYRFEACSHIILIPSFDTILLELFKTPLREVMPILYPKLIAQYVQEAIYDELINEEIVNEFWKDYNDQLE